MCGIVGVASTSAVEKREWLIAGCDALKHRGPDSAGQWWSDDGKIGFGHRRLAIVDLSPGGHQPMHYADDNLSITFNGEIYNYQDLKDELSGKGFCFRTESDTEVLLAAYQAWGVECLTRLNGMFSFGIYDAARKRVFLARDRAGEKPMYYALRDGTLRFASELKALLINGMVEARMDHVALDQYLTLGYVPSPSCIISGVQKLSPAHALTFNVATGDSRLWRYWSLPAPASLSSVTEAELVDELDELLADAVRRQLVADVPVGVLLSGGVDSSLITAMAARTGREIRTFCVTFSGFGTFDESEHARLIARHFGTSHTELDAGVILPSILPRLARQFDEPLADSSMIPTHLVSRLVRKHCTVALGGDGGDELFGGYMHYSRLIWTRDRLGWVPRPLRKVMASAGTGMLPIGFKGRNWLESLGGDMEKGVPRIGEFFDAETRARLLEGSATSAGVAEQIWDDNVPDVPDYSDRASRMDWQTYLPADILCKVDRASMLESLEVRAPLLDYHVVEFAFGKVPAEMKNSIGQRKILLKALARRVLPPEFDFMRKQGFSVPMTEWLSAGPWLETFREVLLDRDTIFSRPVVESLLRGQALGRRNNERLFALVVFEMWRREYGVSL